MGRRKSIRNYGGRNVWAGIVGLFLILVGLFVLNGLSYCDFLLLLKDVPRLLRQKIWYKPDSVSSHVNIHAREFLNEVFNNRDFILYYTGSNSREIKVESFTFLRNRKKYSSDFWKCSSITYKLPHEILTIYNTCKLTIQVLLFYVDKIN